MVGCLLIRRGALGRGMVVIGYPLISWPFRAYFSCYSGNQPSDSITKNAGSQKKL